jgi:hypothetical protein
MTLCSYITFSQNYYQVKVLGVDYTQIQIDQAFASADFCGSHKYSERRELTFNDGTVIELLGSTELATIDSSCSQPNDLFSQMQCGLFQDLISLWRKIRTLNYR